MATFGKKPIQFSALHPRTKRRPTAPIPPPRQITRPSLPPVRASALPAVGAGDNALPLPLNTAQQRFNSPQPYPYQPVVGSGRSFLPILGSSAGGVFAFGSSPSTGEFTGRGVANTAAGQRFLSQQGQEFIDPDQAGIPRERPRADFREAFRGAITSPSPRTSFIDVGGESVALSFEDRAALSTGSVASRRKAEARIAARAAGQAAETARIRRLDREDELAQRDQRFKMAQIQEENKGLLAKQQEISRGKLGVQELKSATDTALKVMDITDAGEARQLEEDMNTANNMSAELRNQVTADASLARTKMQEGTDSPADRAAVALEMSATIGELGLIAAQLEKSNIRGGATVLRRQMQQLADDRAKLLGWGEQPQAGGEGGATNNAGLVDKNNNGSVVDEAQAEIADIDRALLDGVVDGEELSDDDIDALQKRKKVLQGIK